jgi:hypothetical protein
MSCVDLSINHMASWPDLSFFETATGLLHRETLGLTEGPVVAPWGGGNERRVMVNSHQRIEAVYCTRVRMAIKLKQKQKGIAAFPGMTGTLSLVQVS